MSFDPNWIVAIVGVLGLLGGLWKIASAIGQNNEMTKQILSNQKSQWAKIDEANNGVKGHETRIVKLESWKEFHSGNHEAVK